MRSGRALAALLVAACLVLLTGLLVAGVGPWAGPMVFSLSPTHGVHAGDIPVLFVCAAGLVGCAALSRRG